MLTNNPKTHYIILWDKSQINITKAQYDFYKEEVELKKHNEFITIDDSDTKEILFEWRCSEIKRFVERKSSTNSWWYRYICSFWNKHHISESCECSKEFDCLWIIFKWRLQDMWFEVFYDSDINNEMRTAYKQRYNLTK